MAGQRMLVAVSGGVDSIALLHLMQAGMPKGGELHVLHVEHGIRGDHSVAASELVRKTAHHLRVPFHEHRCDIPAIALEKKLSLETAAREERHRFFAQKARELNTETLVLAHHLDDQAETLLMRLLRGSGIDGLSGMRNETSLVITGTKLTLWRPLLPFRKRELEALAETNEWSIAPDESNETACATRNRVRLELLPLCDEIIAKDSAALVGRASELRREQADLLNQLLDDHPLPRREHGLCVESLRNASPALRRRWLHQWLNEERISNITRKSILEIERVALSDGKPAKTNLPQDRCVRRKARILFLDQQIRLEKQGVSA